MVKVQFFLDKTNSGWKLIGYQTDLNKFGEQQYWDNSQYVYDGNKVIAHVMCRSSVIPTIAGVLKMVAEYLDNHKSLAMKM